VLSELFPLDMRGFGMGISVLVLWMTNAIIAFVFPVLVATVQIQGAFLVFVVLGLIAILTLNKLLPETGERSLEEL
jgi:major inositol transporter-like SP family MFS transporter